MYWIIRWILFAASVMIVAWIVPGISVSGFLGALIVSLVMGMINVLVKPFVYFISIPINVLSIGLFSFVINALLLMLAGAITPGFSVDGFLSALFGSIILSIFAIPINNFAKNKVTNP